MTLAGGDRSGRRSIAPPFPNAIIIVKTAAPPPTARVTISMLRAALRNVAVMLCLALPLFVVATLLVGWFRTAEHSPGGGQTPSVDDFFASMLFMYVIWALPALALAATHQLVLAAIRRDWSARSTRLVILATVLGMAGLLTAYVWSVSTRDGALALAAALLPPAIAYGLLARPLRPTSS